MLEDKLLMARYNRDDKEIIRRIYQKYKDQLVTLAAALLYDKQTAEDVVHDVFIMLINTAGKMKLTSSLKSFLSVCVANKARTINQRARLQTSRTTDFSQITADLQSPDLSAIFGEETARLTEAMKELPYEQLETLMLKTYSGVKFKAIAQAQGVTVNTVQGRYRYGLEKLRSMLNGEVEK